jgi:hypothetical protein
MKKIGLLVFGVFAGVSALGLPYGAANAQQGSTPPAWASEEHREHFDWIQHTQQTLKELRAKLNLGPAQTSAWDTWSQGVMQDARQQLAQKTSLREERADGAKDAMGATTPERMSRGIERLRADTNWMQEHLVQLEAAQVRTKAFYGALDTNQRTIFDLFWHEMHHRTAGHDDAPDTSQGEDRRSMLGQDDRSSGRY